MTDFFKQHIFAKKSEGKVRLDKTACGRWITSSPDGGAKLAKKSKEFNLIIRENGKGRVCMNCLAKAKEEGRISERTLSAIESAQ